MAKSIPLARVVGAALASGTLIAACSVGAAPKTVTPSSIPSPLLAAVELSPADRGSSPSGGAVAPVGLQGQGQPIPIDGFPYGHLSVNKSSSITLADRSQLRTIRADGTQSARPRAPQTVDGINGNIFHQKDGSVAFWMDLGASPERPYMNAIEYDNGVSPTIIPHEVISMGQCGEILGGLVSEPTGENPDERRLTPFSVRGGKFAIAGTPFTMKAPLPAYGTPVDCIDRKLLILRAGRASSTTAARRAILSRVDVSTGAHQDIALTDMTGHALEAPEDRLSDTTLTRDRRLIWVTEGYVVMSTDTDTGSTRPLVNLSMRKPDSANNHIALRENTVVALDAPPDAPAQLTVYSATTGQRLRSTPAPAVDEALTDSLHVSDVAIGPAATALGH